jgi:hypothetical protein
VPILTTVGRDSGKLGKTVETAGVKVAGATKTTGIFSRILGIGGKSMRGLLGIVGRTAKFFGPAGLAIGAAALIATHWGAVTKALAPLAKAVWGAISKTVVISATQMGKTMQASAKFIGDTMRAGFHTAESVIGSALGVISNVAKQIGHGIEQGIQVGVNGAVRALHGLVSTANHLASIAERTVTGIASNIGSALVKVSSIPNRILGWVGLEAGGVLSAASGGMRVGSGGMTHGPQVLVGEGRRAFPEFVVPTDPMHHGNAVKLYAALGAKLAAAGTSFGTASPAWSSAGAAGATAGGAVTYATSYSLDVSGSIDEATLRALHVLLAEHDRTLVSELGRM